MTDVTVLNVAQRSAEWVQARIGRLTASVAAEMLAKIKSGEAAGRRNLRVRLTLERLTGKSLESLYVSPAMEVGIEREVEAFAAYEALTGEVAQRTGFLSHNRYMAGCSLDGHLGDFTKLLSIKCRQPPAHLETLRQGIIPNAALAQMRHELWITGAESHDYFSWNPDFPPELRTRIITLPRAKADIPAYEEAALTFLAEVDREVEAVRTMTDLTAVLKETVNT